MGTFLSDALTETGMAGMSDFGSDDTALPIVVDAPTTGIQATASDLVQMSVTAAGTMASLLQLANGVAASPTSTNVMAFQLAYNAAVHSGNAEGPALPSTSGVMDQYTHTALAAVQPTAGISGDPVGQRALGNYYAPPDETVQSAASALDTSPDKTPDLVAAFQSAFNAAGGRPQLALDGNLGPATIAALASYVSGEELQAYFTALGDSDPVASLASLSAASGSSGSSGSSAVSGESDKHGFDYVPNALEFGTTRDPIGSNARRWWRGWGRPVVIGADGVTPVVAGPPTAPAGMAQSAATLLQNAGSSASAALITAFQKAYNASLPTGTPAAQTLDPDGILGPQTQAAMQAALSRAATVGTASPATLTRPSVPVLPAGGATAALQPQKPTDWLPLGGAALFGLGAGLGAFFGWLFAGSRSVRDTSPGPFAGPETVRAIPRRR